MRIQGYATLTTPEGVKERDTFTCAHCNKIVHIPPRIRGTREMPGGGCGNCKGMICNNCVAVGSCTPFEEKLARYEARMNFRKQAGIGG